MIEKVLFKLVQDKKDRTTQDAAALLNEFVKRKLDVDLRYISGTLPYRRQHIMLKVYEEVFALPVAESDYCQTWFFAQFRHDARQQNRALAHTTRPIQNRQPRGIQV